MTHDTSSIQCVAKYFAEPHEEIDVHVCQTEDWRLTVIQRDINGRYVSHGSAHIGGDEVTRLKGDGAAVADLVRGRIECARSLSLSRGLGYRFRIGRKLCK